MKAHKKTSCSKGFGPQLLSLLLLGALGGALSVSQAESSIGIDNAKKGFVRDPFWPVGYVPVKLQGGNGTITQKALAGSGSIDWSAAMKKVVINGVSSRAGNEYFAVINNELKTVGESVSVRHGKRRYTWQVGRIAPPSSVKLRRVSAE